MNGGVHWGSGDFEGQVWDGGRWRLPTPAESRRKPANCTKCGTTLPFGRSGKCDSCAAESQSLEGHSKNGRNYDQEISSYVHQAMENIKNTLAGEDVAYLYKSVHVPVDSLIDEVSAERGLDLSDVTMAGSVGWEVVGVVPRTYSGSQSYVARRKMTGSSFGGGSTLQQLSLSGNIIGVYLIMRWPITKETLATRREAIRGELEACAMERLGLRQ